MICPGWFNMKLTNEALISLSNRCYDHCKNVFYPFSLQELSRKPVPSWKWCNLLVQTITEKMESNRQRLMKKICHRVVSCVNCSQLLRTKTLVSGSKWVKHFLKFLPLFALYLLSGCDLFNMSCLSQISLMASLDVLCSKALNLKIKIKKIEHKKIFCSRSKILKNISWPSIYA